MVVDPVEPLEAFMIRKFCGLSESWIEAAAIMGPPYTCGAT
jgi:hypothetical protein